MGHHIDAKGRFQSDKRQRGRLFSTGRPLCGEEVEIILRPDHIVFDFEDQAAQIPLWVFAALTQDAELREDVVLRVTKIFVDKMIAGAADELKGRAGE